MLKNWKNIRKGLKTIKIRILLDDLLLLKKQIKD